jgi:hypothetical protein
MRFCLLVALLLCATPAWAGKLRNAANAARTGGRAAGNPSANPPPSGRPADTSYSSSNSGTEAFYGLLVFNALRIPILIPQLALESRGPLPFVYEPKPYARRAKGIVRSHKLLQEGELLQLVAAETYDTSQIGAAKQQTGVVVRQNEIIEDGPERTDKEIADTAARVANVFKQLGLGMASVRQYGFSHPQTRGALTAAYDDVVTILAQDPTAMRWDVEPGAFTFGGHPVWAPDRVPFDRIPHQLFADGVRRVQFKQGIAEQELLAFVAILLRDVSNLVTSEDDAVTALWDRRFEHVAYLAVDSFTE